MNQLLIVDDDPYFLEFVEAVLKEAFLRWCKYGRSRENRIFEHFHKVNRPKKAKPSHSGVVFLS
ncbi:hypothetical protein [Listeria ilorinensis]|uniref:hypothetical protein n=1 Tax=Listeria ilorinensis TaxID=2867439 RepID=UPI001EF73511|nr:hypothetical protein [Listeria ilorinensis]